VHGARGCMGVGGIAFVRTNAVPQSTLFSVAMPRELIAECHS
jgi:hypothetical protein